MLEVLIGLAMIVFHFGKNNPPAPPPPAPRFPDYYPVWPEPPAPPERIERVPIIRETSYGRYISTHHSDMDYPRGAELDQEEAQNMDPDNPDNAAW
jgi:hypothetical protein